MPDQNPNDYPINYLDIAAFSELGYLQECNRRLLHPHGLALEWMEPGEPENHALRAALRVAIMEGLAKSGMADVPSSPHGAVADAVREQVWALLEGMRLTGTRLSGVWDYRDDAEGINYGGDYLIQMQAKAIAVKQMEERRRPARVASLGYWIQPLNQIAETGVE